MPAPSFPQSTVPLTLGDLQCFDYHVSPTTLAQTVFHAFERMPHLPGVLLVDRHEYVGMVSRNQCFAGAALWGRGVYEAPHRQHVRQA